MKQLEDILGLQFFLDRKAKEEEEESSPKKVIASPVVNYCVDLCFWCWYNSFVFHFLAVWVSWKKQIRYYLTSSWCTSVLSCHHIVSCATRRIWTGAASSINVLSVSRSFFSTERRSHFNSAYFKCSVGTAIDTAAATSTPTWVCVKIYFDWDLLDFKFMISLI